LAWIYQNFSSLPFEILSFPCNQFANQEPHSNEVIQQFAHSKGAWWPFFAKSDVNGACTATDGCKPDSTDCCAANNDIYAYIKSVEPGPVLWNFQKYLVNADGIPVKKYLSAVEPLDIVPDIKKLLAGDPLDE
jgi:glutathione peroxidase